MAQQESVIEIKDGLVTVYQKQIEVYGKLEDILPKLVMTTPVTLPTIPRTAVFAHWDESLADNKLYAVLCEISPGTRSITKSGRLYRLAMPWTYIWFIARKNGAHWALDDYRCFHAPKQYDGLNSPLYVAFLPNISRDTGAICFGQTGAPGGLSIDKQMDFLVNNWYNSPFNNDLSSSQTYPFGGGSFKAWVEASQSDPTCWEKFPEWKSNGHPVWTVKNLLAQVHAIVRPVELPTSLSIPAINVPFTFGRAEEWLMTLTPQQRYQLKTAFGNLAAENSSGFIEAPEIFERIEDDGGVVITNG